MSTKFMSQIFEQIESCTNASYMVKTSHIFNFCTLVLGKYFNNENLSNYSGIVIQGRNIN